MSDKIYFTDKEVLEVIKDFSKSQGFYGRLYEALMEMKELYPHEYEMFQKYVREKKLTCALDVILLFEE